MTEDYEKAKRAKSSTSETEKLLNRTNRTISKTASSITDGKNVIDDISHYRDEVKMEGISGQYKREYHHQMEKQNMYQYSSPADRKALETAKKGLDESAFDTLKTSDSNKSTEKFEKNYSSGGYNIADSPRTDANESHLSVTMKDDRGNIVTVKAGEAIMLDNGALVGFDIDSNGEGYVFTNFYNNSLVSDGRNILNKDREGYVAGGMTLKTGVKDENAISISELIGSNGVKIITIDMSQNKEISKLATQIKGNDQTKNKLLSIDEDSLKKLKTEAKITIGAVVVVRGATFAADKVIKTTSLLFDGMGTDKNEMEFASDRIIGIAGNKTKQGINAAAKRISRRPATAIKTKVSKTAVKVTSKVSSVATKQLSKTKAGRIVLKGANHFGKFGKAFSAGFRKFKAKLKKYVIIILAVAIIFSQVLLISTSIMDGVMNTFGFLFGSGETDIWKDYEEYIKDINDKIEKMNSQFTSKGIVPKIGAVLPTSPVRLKSDASSYGIELQETGDYNSIAKHNGRLAYTIKVDEKGTLETRYYSDLGTTYSGNLQGINWRGFFSCIQIYNEATSQNDKKIMIESQNQKYNQDDEIIMYRPDRIIPFVNYKNLWGKSISQNEFIDISVSAIIDTNCYVDSKGLEADGSDFIRYQEELILYSKGKRINEEKEAYKTALSNSKEGDYQKYYYPTRRQEYIQKYGSDAGFQCTYSQFLNAVKNGNYKLSVKKPENDEKATDVYNKYKDTDGPEEIRHAYQINYYMNDNGDQSLKAYSQWFNSQYYSTDSEGKTHSKRLTREEQEMLDTLYASETLFDSFPQSVRDILESSMSVNFETGSSSYLSQTKYEFILKIVEYQYEIRDKYDILPSVTVAQAIEESGWGTSNIAKQAKNLFGMKGEYNGQSYTSPNGTKWRKYSSWKQSVEDHAKLLCNSTYSCSGLKDYKTILTKLQRGGYCEGAGYTTRILSHIESYNLTQYDNLTNEQLKQVKNGTFFSDGGMTLDGIVYYNQGDYPNIRYSTSTIAKSGCAPTSMAIVISTLTGNKVTPKQTGDYAASKGCYVPGAGSTHNTPNILAEHWGLKCYETSNLNEVKSALTSRKMVVCLITGTSRSPGTTYRDSSHGGHYMVLYGYNKATNRVYTADCGSRAKSTCVNRNVTWDIRVFDSLNNGGVVKHSYWIFSK